MSVPNKKVFVITSIMSLIILSGITQNIANSTESIAQETCRPKLIPISNISLGKPGEFRWNCSGAESEIGFYIVFIRPSGTYVLLKVPRGRNSFEFTPDVPGAWRWIVIHTDPDRSKPDAESEPGSFIVSEDSDHN